MEFKEFKQAFLEEGITQERIINRLWILRIEHTAFSDNFKNKEELKRAIRDFKEFTIQLLYSNFPV